MCCVCKVTNPEYFYDIDRERLYLWEVSTWYNDEQRSSKKYDSDGKTQQDIPYNGAFFAVDKGTRFEGTMKNGMIVGVKTTTYKDGSKLIETYVDDVMNGPTTKYYANGQRAYEMEYKPFFSSTVGWEPKKIGTETTWREDGTLKGITEWSTDGHTSILGDKQYNEKGLLAKEITRDPATRTESVVTYTYNDEGVKTSMSDGLRKVYFYPDGAMKAEAFTPPVDGVKEKQYYTTGELSVVFCTDGSRIQYYTNGKNLRNTSAPDAKTGNMSYTKYNDTGDMTESGIYDKSYKVLEHTLYKDGIKTDHIDEVSGITTYYAPEGYVLQIRNENTSLLTEYDASGKVIFKLRDSKTKDAEGNPLVDYVEFYSNGIVKKKGVMNRIEQPVKWYLYSEKGKLASIWENGVERKPNKEEKSNHLQFLHDMVPPQPERETVGSFLMDLLK